jgi:hypothetical protein
MASEKNILTHIINLIALHTIPFSLTDSFFGKVFYYPVYSDELADT